MMREILERLYELELAEREVSYGMDMDPAKTANWRYAETAKAAAIRIEKAEQEAAAWKKECGLNEHRVITCGVAASHPDANLSRTGAYIDKWNSKQAEEVRVLRDAKERAEQEASALRELLKEARSAYQDGYWAGWTPEFVAKLDEALK